MIDPNAIKKYVDQKFDYFGGHRKQEISRLLFEISKREQCHFTKIIEGYSNDSRRFDDFKRYLIEKRFPVASQYERKLRLPLFELDIEPRYRASLQKREIIPQNIFIEQSVQGTDLVKRLKKKFPQANCEVISSYKEYTEKKRFSVEDYNNRLSSFYIIRENFDFLKRCPCSKGSVRCGYHVMNLGSGCAYECSYCCLQDYINSRGIILPANIEDFFREFERYQQNIRLGTGELTDSLVFDHITEYSPLIVEFFKKYPKSTFEFKTKSTNIELLLTNNPGPNIIVSWSLNPQKIIDAVEFFTPSLQERLEVAGRCLGAGYRIGFHFDPIIYYSGWQKDYQDAVNQIFDRIPEKFIYYISLGTLRMKASLKKIIENRFPENTILDEELVLGYDKKLRYSESIRADIYKKMMVWIRKRSLSVYVYLCMEEKAICENCMKIV